LEKEEWYRQPGHRTAIGKKEIRRHQKDVSLLNNGGGEITKSKGAPNGGLSNCRVKSREFSNVGADHEKTPPAQIRVC